MPTQEGQLTSTDGGWLARICGLPKSLILASAKGAGRATRISHDGASAMAKGMGQAAAWSKDRVAGSTRLLNPFGWTKGHDKSRDESRRQEAPLLPEKSPPRKIVDRKAPAALPVQSKAPEKVSPLAANKVVESKPRPEPKPRRGESPRSQPAGWARGEVPPEVTSSEVSAAVFGGVSEKVMFARALKDFASQGQATRARAAAVLGTISHNLSVRALAARLARDPSAEVRKECVNALTEIGRSDGLPAVERALFDSSSAVRLAAVRGVYRLAGTVGTASLVRMLSDEDEGVRRRAAVCIGWLGCPELTVDLIPLLRSASVWVRLAALDALENLKSPAAVDHVIARLEDPEESVQRRAFEVLRTITGKQMGETFPQDEKGRRFMIARWRAWREESRGRGRPGPA